MKRTKILYWVFTGLLAALMLFSGIQNMMVTPQSVELIEKQLGYPHYFIFFVGLVKILGVIGILVPGYPRVTEWAYAGLTFDLLSAIYSMNAIGEPFAKWALMLIFVAILAASYIFYHKKRKLAL